LIPYDSSSIWLEVALHPSQGFEEAVDSSGGFPLAVGQAYQGMKRAISVVVTVNKEEFHRGVWVV